MILKIRQVTAIIMIAALFVAFIPALSGNAYAAGKSKRPGQVKGIKIKKKGTKITITWKKVKGAKGYAIYIDGNRGMGYPPYKKKTGMDTNFWDTTKKTKYKFKGVWGSKYKIRVYAFNKNGEDGKSGKVKTVKIRKKVIKKRVNVEKKKLEEGAIYMKLYFPFMNKTLKRVRVYEVIECSKNHVDFVGMNKQTRNYIDYCHDGNFYWFEENPVNDSYSPQKDTRHHKYDVGFARNGLYGYGGLDMSPGGHIKVHKDNITVPWTYDNTEPVFGQELVKGSSEWVHDKDNNLIENAKIKGTATKGKPHVGNDDQCSMEHHASFWFKVYEGKKLIGYGRMRTGD